MSTQNQPPIASVAPIALVTGAAQRIGHTIALALAKRGWSIAVHYQNSRDEALQTVAAIQALGQTAVALRADLADEAQSIELLARCTAALGLPTCVVNNAARFDYDDATSFSTKTLDRQMHVNLVTPILLARELHKLLSAHEKRGVVVNLLDQKLFNLNPDFLSYTLSKAALHTATTVLAQALAPVVRMVGIAPGITLPSGDQKAENFAQAHQATPMGRSSTPEDIAHAVCFAVEAQAMTGTTLIVDGGQHLVPTMRDIMFLTQ